MLKNFAEKVLIPCLAVFCVLLIGGVAVGLGLALSQTENIKREENFSGFSPALPTKIVDINGVVITEFAGEQKRELISLAELPDCLIDATIAREDPDFYKHKGFTIRAIARAAWGQAREKLFHKSSLGGGSTITQQVAGTLYTNRAEYTMGRKVRELWWAIQMERRYTKNEILEIYLNYMYMGPGVYGVEAASKYYFGHSARDITLAEAAVLVIQLSAPSRYNPLANPNVAMQRQKSVLDKMVELGYTTEEEAAASFDEYWANYDYTRSAQSAHANRDDKAPWFSEYVRRQLDGMMYQSMDYYRDGYTVRTTLDLSMQEAAEKYMQEGLARANRIYASQAGNRLNRAEATWIPIVNLLGLTLDANFLAGTSSTQNQSRAISRYTKQLNSVVDIASMLFGLEGLSQATDAGYAEMRASLEQTKVEGALIAIENSTGHVKAIVGGSKYDSNNQWIRAVQGQMMPGSSFKPLYYSAAIDSREFTSSSLIYDIPVVFHTENGVPYIPLNFRGEWQGTTLFYNALAQSMNVPSLKVLDTIGFDAAINRAAALLGITDPEVKRRTFPRVYPMGLGIISISPIQMARAFAIFANAGREVVPIAILQIEDRNGRIIIDNQADVQLKQRQKGRGAQIVSEQNAYIMTQLLTKTVEIGTLRSGSGFGSKFQFTDKEGKKYSIAAAGKTGTTQNWSDAWTVGFTPYYTTAIWFGFDKPGNSLGLDLTGATLAGPIWGDFMREIHAGLPAKSFTRPENGVEEAVVCTKSGALMSSSCPSGVRLPFLAGTVPGHVCEEHSAKVANRPLDTMRRSADTFNWGGDSMTGSLSVPTVDASLFDFLTRAAPAPAAARKEDALEEEGVFVMPEYNYLME